MNIFRALQFSQFTDDVALVKVREPLVSDLYDLYARLPIKGQYFMTGTPVVLAGNEIY